MQIVLLPGLDGTGILFKPLIDVLERQICIKIISYPTHVKLNYEELTELVIRQLPNENFILVGESFSGYIAYQVALRKPKHLKSVIFVAKFLYNPRPLMLGLSNILPRSYLLSNPLPDKILKSF